MSTLDRKPPSVGAQLTGGDLLHGREAPPQLGREVSEESGQTDEAGSDDWLSRARDAYFFSTTYVDSNYRKKWEDGIRAFNNQHPLDSKYVSPNYSKRSSLYRPLTRASIRKTEAAAAQAFFSNMDVVSIEALNQGNKAQVISASVMKELLQYRLTKSIPWFQTVLGGVQDAQTVGVVVSRQYWEYKEVEGKVVKDTSCVKLLPIENLRIDPGAEWTDPIQTSPYLIEMIPMYIQDVREMMDNPNSKTGRPAWKKYGDGMIRQATQDKSDSTRITRNKDRTDPYEPDGRPVSDYEIVWVQRHIHRRNEKDWVFYTLADIALLTDPVPLTEEVFHGERDYAMGCAILETHKILPSGVPELSNGLQTEANEVSNQRLDNVKFVLNKKWFAKRGKNVDIASLVRNVPGGVTLMDDVETDVKEVNWPDVTSSAYQEQDRIGADLSNLLGDFNPAAAQLTRKGNEPAKVMQLMAQSGSPLIEYMLRTITETWIEKVLRQLVKLEQYYETDQVIMSIAAGNAKIFEKYGINQVTDDLLNQDLTLRVNVGMGATDPQQKVQKLMNVVGAVGQLLKEPPPGMNVGEVSKELFGFAGYQDGKRFLSNDDPEKDALKKQLQHGQDLIKELVKRHQENMELEEKDLKSKEKIATEKNQTTLEVAKIREHETNRREQFKQDKETERAALAHLASIHTASVKPKDNGTRKPH